MTFHITKILTAFQLAEWAVWWLLQLCQVEDGRHFIQWRAEAVGCPGPTRFLDAIEHILYSSRKISDDLF